MNQWFTATLQNVKEKSLDAIEFVKKDLVDFTSTVKNDTENYLKKIQSQPIGEFGINRIVSRLNPTKSSENNHEKPLISSTSYDRFHNECFRLQNDESTYLIDPNPIDVYETWRTTNSFHIENFKNEISQLLINAPHIRSIYARLVPACTTHADFWSRYYFRLHQLNEEENKRINLLKRAHEICNETHENDWEDSNDECLKDNYHIDRALPMMTIVKENDADGSWDSEFDENDLPKSSTNITRLDLSKKELPMENSMSKNTDNQSEDEWE